MVRTRAEKIQRIADSLPPLVVDDPSGAARVLVVRWGSTYGPISSAVRQVRNTGFNVAQLHLRDLLPFPHDLGDILRSYDRVLVPEMNLGQLSLLAARRRPSRSRRAGSSFMSAIELGVPSVRSGLELVPAARKPRSGKDYTSDQEVRLVPRLRRLRRAQGRPVLPARPGPAPGEHRLRFPTTGSTV